MPAQLWRPVLLVLHSLDTRLDRVLFGWGWLGSLAVGWVVEFGCSVGCGYQEEHHKKAVSFAARNIPTRTLHGWMFHPVIHRIFPGPTDPQLWTVMSVRMRHVVLAEKKLEYQFGTTDLNHIEYSKHQNPSQIQEFWSHISHQSALGLVYWNQSNLVLSKGLQHAHARQIFSDSLPGS